AVSLPFTIGVEIRRDAIDAGARIVMRTDDFSGLRLFTSGGAARGISVGLSRIVWYLLLTSSFLASMGKVPADRKLVTMVFYDVRDVSFDETGLSENMRATLETLKKEQGDSRPLASLSEMRLWMHHPGVHITLL